MSKPDEELARFRAAVEQKRKVLKAMDEVIPTFKDASVRAAVTAKRDEVRRELDAMLSDLAAVDMVERLQEGAAIGTMGSMETVAPSPGGAVSAGKTKFPTPFQKALHKRGLSLPGWVVTKKKFHLKLETAKGWVKRPGKGGRPVPRLWADRIAAEFGEPTLADPDNWPNGIRD